MTLNKKTLFALICVLLCCNYASAQIIEETQTQESTFLDKASVGMKFGFHFPNMRYSDKDIQSYSSDTYAKFVFELFGEYQFNSALSVRPGFKFLTRGQHIEEADLKYYLDAKYTDLTIPLIYTFKTPIKLCPYLFAGLAIGFARGGTIKLGDSGFSKYDDFYEVKVSKGNFKSLAFGLFFGAGAKYPIAISDFPLILGFEMGYHLGLTNTYSGKEDSGESIALNAYSYEINGTRKNRGLEIGFTVAIPLNAFKKVKLPKRKPKADSQTVKAKKCYTLEEIKELIRSKQDIQGKKICAIQQISFEFGKSTLTRQDKIYLNEIVNLMKTNEDMKIRVNGHTDDVGTEEFNLNLSRDRAKAVFDYIVSQGISLSRLSYKYYGDTRPIADNDTEEGRAENRRVEFEFINQ